jgi:hypothetical protein
MLPQELTSYIGSENVDFAITAGRALPLKKSLTSLLFSTVWTIFSVFTLLVFIGPVLLGGESHFSVNGTAVVAGPHHLGPLIFPAIFIGIFVLVGILFLYFSIKQLFKKGGYFIGTPSRLVHFQDGQYTSFDWNQFSGIIDVLNKGTYGDLSLQMKTGRMVRKERAPNKYVPDYIYISEIPNVLKVEKMCRERINQNDIETPIAY